jgi:putative PEP-CTERM system TPR-repeat lipoprotein
MDDATTILSIRGGAYLSLRQLDNARAAFAEALKINPKHVQSMLGLASIAIATNDMRSAESNVDSALAIAPRDVDALLFKGDLLRQQGKPQEALASYMDAAKVDPTQYSPLLRLAVLQIAQGKLTEAKESLAKVEKIHSGLSDRRYFSALIYFREGQIEQAQSQVQDVLKQAPNNAPANLLAGAIAYRKGYYSSAEAYLEPVVKVFPMHTPTRKLLADVQLKAGHTERALATLQTGLKLLPDDEFLLLQAGDASYQAQHFAQANEYYAKASKLSPDNLTLRTRHGMSQLALGQTEQAMAELEFIANEDKIGGQADYLLVRSYLNRKDYGKAMNTLSMLQKKQPKNPQVYHLKADVLLAQNNRQAAIQALEEAYSLRPSYLPTVMRLVSFDIQNEKPEVAQKRFEYLLETDPKNVDAMTAFAVFLFQQVGKREQAMVLLERAHKLQPSAIAPATVLIEQLIFAGEKNKALSYAQQIVADRPDSSEAIYLLARTQLTNGQNNQALASYHKLVSLTPDAPMSHFRLAGVQASMNDNEGAQSSLKKVLQLQPDFVDALVLLVKLQVKVGNLSGAFETVKAAQQRPTSAYQAYILEGDLLVEKKQPDDALASYQKALELNNNAVPLIKICALHKLVTNQKKIELFVAQWLKANPADLTVRTFLAQSNLRERKYLQAAEYYREIIKLKPNNTDALNNLAWVYHRLNDPRALNIAEAAVAQNPGNPLAMDTLAVILLQKGEKRRSLGLLQKAATSRPADAEISTHLAWALSVNGLHDQAKAVLLRVEASGDSFVKQAEFKEIASLIR